MDQPLARLLEFVATSLEEIASALSYELATAKKLRDGAWEQAARAPWPGRPN